MKRRICNIGIVHSLLLLPILFFFVSGIAQASSGVVITEIFYDAPGSDSDHEWIEIQNTGSSTVTISGGSGDTWRFNDGSNHLLADTATRGSMSLPVNGYAVIASNADVFLTDHSGYSGTVIDTSMSLGNTSGVVKIIDESGNILDTVSYTNTMGGAGDGNSLQLVGSSWVGGVPTPGAGNSGGNSSGGGGDTGGGGTGGGGTTTGGGSGTTTTPTTPKAYEPPRMKGEFLIPSNGIAGVPIDVSVKVVGLFGETRQKGEFYFSFGDGTVKKLDYFEPFEHTYDYSGTYVAIFTYKSNQYLLEPEIKIRQVVEIAEPHVFISSVSDVGTIELKNPSDSEAEISDWAIINAGGTKRFGIPYGTYIISGKSIYLSKTLTGFTDDELASLKLVLPSGNVVSTYPSAPKIEKRAVVSIHSTVSLPVEQSSVPNPVASIEENELQANVLNAITKRSTGKNEIPLYVSLAVGIVGLAGTFYILKKVYLDKKPENELGVSDTEKIANEIRIIE